ncbi:glycine cleavage T C-terminal barrel domain-containing protein, partial [Methyloceanibacter marginalis]
IRKDMEDEPFIGSEALIRRKANPQRKLVGLDIDSNECVHHGDPVYKGRAQVGVVTSSTRSPILKKNIALARLDISESELGTGVEIGKLDGHQKRIPAKVVGFPHYDPQKTRVRA